MQSQEKRPGEKNVDVALSRDAFITFIGHIETPWDDRQACPRQGTFDGPECRLILSEPWSEALKGIEAYSRLDVLYWLDKSRRDLVTQSPKWDGKTTGTFALRSPVRPNPIGLSSVTLLNREGPVLVVRGLDCLNGTPLIDIKPNRSDYVPPALPKRTGAT